jgi:hypothetical protein
MSFFTQLWEKEPTRVIGYVVALLVMVYAYWRGLSIPEVLVQLGALVFAVEGIRSRVTPYIESMTHPTRDEIV